MLVDVPGRGPTQPALPSVADVELQLVSEVSGAVVILQLEQRFPGAAAEGTAIQGLVGRWACWVSLLPFLLLPAVQTEVGCSPPPWQTVGVPPVGAGGAVHLVVVSVESLHKHSHLGEQGHLVVLLHVV